MKQQVIQNIKKLPKSRYGDYQPYETILTIIAKTMGYETRLMIGGKYTIVNHEEFEKSRNILNDMVKDGTLKKSKSGSMLKLKA